MCLNDININFIYSFYLNKYYDIIEDDIKIRWKKIKILNIIFIIKLYKAKIST